MYGESICAIAFDFRELERSLPRSLRFRRLIFCKGAELGHMSLLNINRKTIYGESIDAITCEFSELQRFMSRSLKF